MTTAISSLYYMIGPCACSASISSVGTPFADSIGRYYTRIQSPHATQVGLEGRSRVKATLCRHELFLGLVLRTGTGRRTMPGRGVCRYVGASINDYRRAAGGGGHDNRRNDHDRIVRNTNQC
jgi:hypothetical protein